METSHALRFLRSGSGLDSVVSRNVSLRDELRAKHGSKFRTVGEYYGAKQHDVAIIDAAPLVPELASIVSVVADSPESEEAEA